MEKTAFLFLIVIGIIPRLWMLALQKKNFKYLWLTFYIISIPFYEVEKLVTQFNPNDAYGVWGTAIGITTPMVLFVILIPKFNYKTIYNEILANKWILFVILLCIISLLNPYNTMEKTTWIFIVFFLSHIFVFLILGCILNEKEIIKGIFDGLSFLCIVQAILAICYPILQITYITKLFHGEISSGWATRMDTRLGAVGVFLTPGSLALYTIISSTFFFSCYLNKFNKRYSLFILICNIFTIILTYSRTSYLVFILSVSIMYFMYKNRNKNILTISNLLKFVFPMLIFIYWVIFLSPLSDIFLKSDADEMLEARMVHYYMAFLIFNTSPYIGVGLNNHLAFLSKHSFIIKSLASEDDFFQVNPIHNIHLIVLSETGLLGIILWVIFLIRSLIQSNKALSYLGHGILPLSVLGSTFTIIVYGTTGWAPFSQEILPFYMLIFLYFNIFTNKKVIKIHHPYTILTK